jgi:DNA modification methylase
MNNEKDNDLESLYEYEDKNRIKVLEGWIRKNIGEILLNIDDQHMNEAEDWITKAIKADKKNGTMWSLGGDCALYAELLSRKGDKSKAKENLAEAIDILKECGADGWVKKYEQELASLS